MKQPTKTKTIRAWALLKTNGELWRSNLGHLFFFDGKEEVKSVCENGEIPVRLTITYTLQKGKKNGR